MLSKIFQQMAQVHIQFSHNSFDLSQTVYRIVALNFDVLYIPLKGQMRVI